MAGIILLLRASFETGNSAAEASSEPPSTHHACGPGCSHAPSTPRSESRSEAEIRALQAARSRARPFRQWLTQRGQNAELSPTELGQGMALAKARRSAMEWLLREDPDAALEQALSYAEYAALPPELQALVEEPFSTTAQLDVEIACGAGTQLHHRLVGDDGRSWELSMPEQHRVDLTKRDLPVQGLRLDDLATVRSQPFQVLEGADEAYVTREWPSGQSNPALCFSRGTPIEGPGVTAVMGGRVFHFQDLEALASVESALLEADARPGMDSGSSWLLVAASGQTLEQFPAQQFSEETVAASYATTTGSKTALFIMVDFSDAQGQPTNPVALEQLVDVDCNDALVRYSYNQTSMNGTVHGTLYRMPSPKATYVGIPDNSNDEDYDQLHTDAVAAYTSDGNPDPFAAYDTVCVVMTNIGFTWEGLASIGGQRMWLHDKFEDDFTADTITHEFGHNYGLDHASYWVHTHANPNSTNPVNPDGTDEEYGDDFDLMGDGSVTDGHFHPAAKVRLGWIPGSDWEDLVSSADNGTYRITRFDHQSATGSRGLRIAKSDTSDHYWVGFRKDYSEIDDFANGALLSWERGLGSPGTNRCWLVDTTPLSIGGKTDAPITVGRTYSDSASDVHITPVATGGTAPNEWLDVTVNFGSFPGNNNPTGTLLGETSIEARTTVLFNVEASDGVGDSLAYSWDMGDGAVKPNSPAISHSWIQGGSYDISVTVSDMKGGSVKLTSTITVTDPLNSWTSRTSGTSYDLFGIASNDTHAVAVGGAFSDQQNSRGAVILRSSDGINWAEVTPGGSVQNLLFYDICWTGSEFLACGQDYDFGINDWEGVVFSSADGFSWTQVYQSNTGGTGLNGITDNGSGVIVAVGDNGTIVRRSSGGAWTTPTPGISASNDLQDVAWGDGVFCLVGHHNNPVAYNGDIQVWTSPDGTSWTDYSSGSGLDSWKDFREIAHTGDEFVAGGFQSRVCYSTNAGQNWTTNQGGDRYDVEAFASGGGLVYAVGINRDSGSADVDFISSDGRNWTVVNPGSLTNRNGLCFFNNTFISVGDAGTIRQSGAITSSSTYSDFAATHFPGGGNDALASSNPDADWASNLFEYALGGDPDSSSSIPAGPVFSIDGSNDPVLQIARDQRRSDVAYSVWWSTNLLDWTRQGLTIETDNDTTLRVVADGVDTSSGRGFLQLRVDQ